MGYSVVDSEEGRLSLNWMGDWRLVSIRSPDHLALSAAEHDLPAGTLLDIERVFDGSDDVGRLGRA